MPTYNGQKYIEAAIDSLLLSTYSNFELIVTDDCSTDDTHHILSEYSKKDSRIKVFRNLMNLGDYANRNEAAKLATGKYIKYLDHDDYIYPWGLDIMVKNMECFPDAGIGLFSLPQNFDSPYPIELTPRECYRYNFFGPGLFYKAPLSAIIRRDIFNSCGGFLEKRFVGDFEFWHRAAQKCNFLLISDHLVWYRVHESQEAKNIQNKFYEYEKIEVSYILDPLSPLLDSERKELISIRSKYWTTQLLRNFMRFKYREALNSLVKIKIYYGRIIL
jgi:glycosyltransferase involved in cell wall biosynthesis